jgi:hypothetical protein
MDRSLHKAITDPTSFRSERLLYCGHHHCNGMECPTYGTSKLSSWSRSHNAPSVGSIYSPSNMEQRSELATAAWPPSSPCNAIESPFHWKGANFSRAEICAARASSPDRYPSTTL